MADQHARPYSHDATGEGESSDGELCVVLPGVQTLTAFLIILPFNQGFASIGGKQHG